MSLTRILSSFGGSSKYLTSFNGNRTFSSPIVPLASTQLLFPFTCIGCSYQPTRHFAKRKGTRIKRNLANLKRAKSRKKEPPKPKKRLFYDTSLTALMVKRFNDKDLPPPPPDDVFYEFDFKRRAYKLQEVLQMHRESHQPSMCDQLDGLIGIRIECNMKTKKKTKFMEQFSGTVTMPHQFELERKTRVAVIVKDIEDQDLAKSAGASLVGGQELIKNLKTNLVSMSEFDHLVCHSEMLIPLTDIRGILGAAFPNKIKGNFGTDIVALTKKFLSGYDYTCKKTEAEKDFGFIDIYVGRLNMEDEQIQENILAVLEDAKKYRIPESPGQFFERIWVSSPPTEEKFLLQFWEFSDFEDLFPIEEPEEKVRDISALEALKSTSTNVSKSENVSR